MIVVSDTGPLCYLGLIGHLDLLPALYGSVIIPPTVATELSSSRSPSSVRAIILNPPAWLTVQAISVSDASLNHLGMGEQEAIALAESIGADLLLCDDQEARAIAKARGLGMTGTLGVLVDAADQNLVDLSDAIDRLRSTNFRVSAAIIKRILDDRKE